MSVGFDHVTLAVTELEEAQRFFSVLGFEEEKAVVASGPTIAEYMGIPNWESDHITLVLQNIEVRQEIQLLHFHHPLLDIDENSGTLSRSGFNHICFRVESIDAMLEKFAAIGVKPRSTILDFHDRKLVFLDGPAEVVIELAEWSIRPPLNSAPQ
jgi:catechol 2,3-dioxygenase-like lactoylglutathione lyase family enzyme